jgi:hypothetical protein
MSGAFHTIGSGDSTTKLAFENGLFPDTIWKHAENEPLRSKRQDMNILHPGDELFIPDKQPKEESCATEQKHRFRRKGVPEKLKVQFFDLHGQPLANKDYMLKIDGSMSRGTLDGNGVLDVAIPPNAHEAEVEVGEKGCLAKAVMHLGGLDPISETTGVQMRLRNLGYFKGAADGESGEALEKAVKSFRVANGLEEKTDIDDELRNKLKDVYGA